MSYQAVNWALAQDVRHSTAKFVLVVMAHHADKLTWESFLSVKSMADKTGQDRKTVMGNLARLVEMGAIRDTGKRVGETKQVPVYVLNGTENGTVETETNGGSVEPNVSGKESAGAKATRLDDGESTKQHHYVYRLSNEATGEFYIGSRTCLGRPESDVAYVGSGRWPRKMSFEKITLNKEICFVFDSREEANQVESDLIADFIDDPACRNKYLLKKVSSTESGTVIAGKADYNSAETGTVSESSGSSNSTVFPANSTVFPPEQYRFSLETVPKTVHGIEHLIEKQKKEKKNKEDEIPDWMPIEAWNGFLQMRRKIKKPMTEEGLRLAVKKLKKFLDAGQDIEAVLNNSTMSNWAGLFEVKASTKKVDRHGGFGNQDYREGVAEDGSF